MRSGFMSRPRGIAGRERRVEMRVVCTASVMSRLIIAGFVIGLLVGVFVL